MIARLEMEERKENEAIGTHRLSFFYSKDEGMILESLSLSISKNSYTCIVGRNGTGKSTLLRIFSGLLIPTSGLLFINGTQVTDENVSELISKQIGIVFQNPDSQFVGATVAEDIAFGLENDNVPYGEIQTKIDEIAEKLNLKDLINREPTKLSGGQMQRVALASVLVRNPSILLLDESTSMLDPLSKQEMISMLKELKSNFPNLTIISVTHETSEIENADYVVALDRERLGFVGTPSELFSNPMLTQDLGLVLPFDYQLKNELRKKRIEVDKFSSPEELRRQLCQHSK